MGGAIDSVPLERQDLAFAPPGQVAEPGDIVHGVGQVLHHVQEVGVLEEPLARVVFREQADDGAFASS